VGILDPDTLFKQSIAGPLKQVQEYKNIDFVVGIPFYNEKNSLPLVLKVIENSLIEMQALEKSLIICVGDPAGTEALDAIKSMDLKAPHLEFLMLPGSNGRGASIRAIMELTNRLDANLVMIAADLIGENGEALHSESLQQILEPIQFGYDFVLTSFKKHYFEDLLGRLFLSPLLEVFYGYRISDPVSNTYAISQDTVGEFCTLIKFWANDTRGFGIDLWMITRAITGNKKICEVPLGFKAESTSLDKLSYVFKDFAGFMFEAIKRDESFWSGKKLILHTPDLFETKLYPEVTLTQIQPTRGLIPIFKRGFNQYHDLIAKACPKHIYETLERNTIAMTSDFHFDSKTWTSIVYNLLLYYGFTPDTRKDDVLEALTASFCGRLAGFVGNLESFQEELTVEHNTYTSTILISRSEAKKEEQRRDFIQERTNFIQKWEQKAWEQKPPLTPADYLEFIPGRPIVLPKCIKGPGNKEIWTTELFSRLQSRYQEKFHKFLEEGLHVPENSSPTTIIRHVQRFMQELEKTIDYLFPGDIYTEAGAKEVTEEIFKLLGYPKVFGVNDKILQEALIKFPPLDLMIPMGCCTSRELLEKIDVRDIITLASLIESRKWTDGIILWIIDQITPEHMEEVELKPLFLEEDTIDKALKPGKVSDFNAITSRIVISPMSKAVGGEYPKLRFFLFVSRHIMIAQDYSLLWRSYAREPRRTLGTKIYNSLMGRLETTSFSAYNIFENQHHRALVNAIEIIAQHLTMTDSTKEAQLLKLMCNSYGVSQVLDDGTFLPCSAWTWASYSAKGGKGIPTPMSSHVEEKWFNHDFLEEICIELGFDTEEITRRIIQLIGDGRGYDDLLDVLLGIKLNDVTVVVQDAQVYPPAGKLVRYKGNPILSPIKEHPWESKYVLNAAAVRINDKVYLLYRAYGDDEVSRIGLAVTDGYNILERLPEPIFVPTTAQEKKGVEDPRVVIIDGELYMLYTAYDGVIAQIAAASIPVEDFLAYRFDKWKRKGLAFQDIWDKDAFLFPEKINGKYVIYHRIEPSIWVTYMDELKFPAPKENHAIIIGPRPGRMWDFIKIGGGAQPIKTKYGWLLIYHGVDKNRAYHLGVFLVPLDDPERVIYRSPNPILSPETEYEIGKPGESWVPNVVFTCGAVPAENKEILDADDEILVYYGAADTHLCLATGTVGELIPEEIRQQLTDGPSQVTVKGYLERRYKKLNKVRSILSEHIRDRL